MKTENEAEIHGHAVISMIIQANKPFSNQSLKEAIEENFGSEARFYICTGGGLSADQLINALWEKGKFKGTEDSFTFNSGKLCSH